MEDLVGDFFSCRSCCRTTTRRQVSSSIAIAALRLQSRSERIEVRLGIEKSLVLNFQIGAELWDAEQLHYGGGKSPSRSCGFDEIEFQDHEAGLL